MGAAAGGVEAAGVRGAAVVVVEVVVGGELVVEAPTVPVADLVAGLTAGLALCRAASRVCGDEQEQSTRPTAHRTSNKGAMGVGAATGVGHRLGRCRSSISLGTFADVRTTRAAEGSWFITVSCRV